MKVSFIGAGNVATHLSEAMQKAGYDIVGVHTRTLASSKVFAARYKCMIAERLSELPASDLYVFSIKDDALAEVVSSFGKMGRKGLCIHTAGSVPMKIFEGNVPHYGVLYPLQTFSKKRNLNFSEIPLFIEASDEESFQKISNLAHCLSPKVYPLDSEGRKKLHLAAVFASNFSNHCYAIAGHILQEAHLPEELLIPLIDETCSKLKEMSAVEGQTGPAVRYDQKVMANQMSLLEGDDLRMEIYKLMSESIHEYAVVQQQTKSK